MMRQETSAPNTRLVNALTGEKAPDAFFKALSEADNLCRELDELHEFRCRIQELESALALARADTDDAAETIRLLINERDDLADELRDLRRLHMMTVKELGRARRAATR